jgi:hypothetical protein
MFDVFKSKVDGNLMGFLTYPPFVSRYKCVQNFLLIRDRALGRNKARLRLDLEGSKELPEASLL